MDFGYFTLSDNHYENNKRSSNQFVADITAEALLADKLGMPRLGSASIISIRSACCRAPTWCSLMSPPKPRASASRRR